MPLSKRQKLLKALLNALSVKQIIIDVPIEEWNQFDCYLICNSCGKWNVLTKENPKDNFL